MAETGAQPQKQAGAAGVSVAEENAATLSFPKEFANAQMLMISEVSVLLEIRKKQAEQLEEAAGGDADEHELNEVFTKTLAYCKAFTKFTKPEHVQAVRSLLQQKRIHRFEQVQLANLVPDSADEARALIPSLTADRIDDEDLEQLLDDLKTYMQAQAYQQS